MITDKTSLTEMAAIVCVALERHGIIATLSGGAAVSIYTENRYVSEDLDFVTAARIDEIKLVLEPMGFEHRGLPPGTSRNHLIKRYSLPRYKKTV